MNFVSINCLCLLLICCSFPSATLVILQYHHISRTTPPSTSTAPEVFMHHLQLIEDSGYQVVGLDEVASLLRQQKPLPDRALLMTFDDAYDSIYSEAFPLLKKKEWPFTVFVATQPVDQKLKGFLSWDQLREMARHGASIANHSVSHSHMIYDGRVQSKAQWKNLSIKEITEAEARIQQEVGHHFKVFSYPYGEFDTELRTLLSAHGYIGMGQHSGAVMNHQQTDLPRFPMGGNYADPIEFVTKINSLAFPAMTVSFTTENGRLLVDGVLPESVEYAIWQIDFANAALVSGLQCFVSQQGQAEKQVLSTTQVRFWPKKPLPAGRSRSNCTAPSEQSGRFYWYSIPFFKPAKLNEVLSD